MNKKQWLGLGLVAVAAIGLAACGNRASKSDSNSKAKTDLKAAVVTDTGGVDDKSFNQSAWEGLQEWGKENGLSKDKGYTYFQSTNESEYANNLEQAASGGYKAIFGIGFALRNAVEAAAKDHSDINYVIIDDEIKGQDNVASALFADNEAAYLAGVAAAKTTKTKMIGFVGGIKGAVLTRFEKGFEAGVKSVDPSIKIDVQYAESFGDAAKGKTIAAAQYAAGADIVYQVAGGTGAGVFNEAKAINETKNESEKVWVIGVDRDQEAEGTFKSKDGKESNFVLASTLKKVGGTVKDLATKAAKKEFPGGKTSVYGLKDGGVDLTTKALSEDAKKAVEDAKAKILDGSIKVPTE
ncbi:basic membrane protein [Streptococcus sp. oral taxon 056 str. F0418]|uniref:BMP family lipoprotein n=1 Tax=Streptococcus sp. oral taxon 056 TaxID=712620 RepID=UPI0002180EDB|nr:BMP family protein [Streptococcus sp. oral taxon 056]EGP67216.1 basic membrane protein [Streptococcus sp. oral taxon 056 str. F0418]